MSVGTLEHSITDSNRPKNKKGVQVFEAGRMVLAQVNGPLDVESTPRFLNRVQTLCRSCHRIVVDLRRADFIDSSGVRALMLLNEELKSHDGELRVVIGEGSRVERTLKLLQLHDRLDVYHSAAEAWVQRPAGMA